MINNRIQFACELKIGDIFYCGDDSVYKVVDIFSDCMLLLEYSFNHGLVKPYIEKFDRLDNWFCDTYYYIYNGEYGNIFENLVYNDHDYLTCKI